MNVRGALVALVAAGSASAACAADGVVFVRKSPFFVDPALATVRDERICGANAGDVTTRIRHEGAVSTIQTNCGVSWVKSADLVGLATFRVMARWTGPRRLEAVDSGDRRAEYLVRPDGSFTVKESVLDRRTDNFREVRRTGRFFVSGDVRWARVGNEPAKDQRMFVYLPESHSLCQGGIDYVCTPIPDPPGRGRQ